MSREREAQILATLQQREVYSSDYKLLMELMELRRAKHRDELEVRESEQTRGRALEIKEIFKLLRTKILDTNI
jgi:hypothetical protein